MDYQNAYSSNYNGNGENKTGYVKRNVNTGSFTFFNEENKMLSLSLYNDFLSISICDKIFDDTGKGHYPPKNERNNKLISRENAMALLNAIDLELVPAMVDYMNSDRSAEFNDKAVLDLSNGVMANSKDDVTLIDIHVTIDKNGDVLTELRMHFGINGERIAKESKVFTFTNSTVVANYNAKDGSCATTQVASQFLLFKRALEQFVDSGAHGVSHDIQQALGYQYERLSNTIYAIAEKNGITTGKRYNNMHQSDSPFKETFRMDNVASEPIQMKEASSMDELLAFEQKDDIPF